MATVISQEELATGIFSMWIKTDKIASQAKAGQFISVYTDDDSRLLPRPISICEVRDTDIRIVYRIAGKGTEEFSHYCINDKINILGPLGNGYTFSNEKAIVIGGGIGIPPMLQVAKSLNCEMDIVLGYRDSNTFLLDEFNKLGKVTIATEDGSLGTKGNVLNAIDAEKITGKVIYACGPTPMLRAIKKYAEENNITAYISLEEKMACGIGACLACVCQSTKVDDHSHVNNKRVCKDGPVFDSREVTL